MARNNIKLLTQPQLEKLNAKYDFYIDKDDIVVALSNYFRITRHNKNKPFHINSRSIVKRKISFNLDGINYWIRSKEEKRKFSLFDVQQAVNVLTITYQEVSYENTIRLLEKNNIKIQMK